MCEGHRFFAHGYCVCAAGSQWCSHYVLAGLFVGSCLVCLPTFESRGSAFLGAVLLVVGLCCCVWPQARSSRPKLVGLDKEAVFLH